MRNRFGYYLSALIILFVLISVRWMIMIKRGAMPGFDQWTRPFVDTVAESPIYTIFRWITEFGSFHFVLPFTIVMVLFLLLMFRDYLPALTFGLGVLTAHLLNQWLKEFIARERPSSSILLNAEGFSFPSGHSMVTIVCYGLLVLLLSKKIASPRAIKTMYIMFGSFVFLIGFSRYILNVHYVTDIFSGFLFGGIILFLCIYVYEKIQIIRTKSNKNKGSKPVKHNALD